MPEKLLRLVGPIHVVAGLGVFLLGFFPGALSQLFSSVSATSEIVWSPFLIAVFGPTVASWGLLFGALVNQYFTTPEERLWRSALYAILIWAPLDSALCIVYGFWAGVALNAVVAITVIALLIAVRSRIRE